MRILLLLVFVITSQLSFGQDDLFGLIDSSEYSEFELADDLLPERMLFTQKLLWGKKGLMRKTGLSPLSRKQRVKELKWRKSMEVGMLGAAPCCFICSHTILPQHASPVERGGI